MVVERRFLNPYAPVQFGKNRLPHRQQDGITYFVTYRLVDSIPSRLLDQWHAERTMWLKFHPEPWAPDIEEEYHKQLTAKIESWLDQGHGSCALRDARIRKPVEDAFRRCDGRRFQMHSWVIMPNHVHVLVSLANGELLDRLIQAWKGASSREIKKVRQQRISMPVWMKDYFDRMIRDSEHFWRCARYIRRNPVKAKLAAWQFTLHESQHVRDILDCRAKE